MENSKSQKYASYNVLARKPLIAGVPIITLVIMLVLMMGTAVLGVSTLGFAKGIIVPLLLALVLFMIRVKCMDDSRAMEDVVWDSKGAFTRVLCRSNVTSFSSDRECKKTRRGQINEFYKIHCIG